MYLVNSLIGNILISIFYKPLITVTMITFMITVFIQKAKKVFKMQTTHWAFFKFKSNQSATTVTLNVTNNKFRIDMKKKDTVMDELPDAAINKDKYQC